MKHPEIALLALGVACLVAALVWRSVAHHSARRRVRRLLTAPDPQARRTALDLVGDGGLAAYAGALLELIANERDPTVLDAVANLVARTLWEPADKAQLVELRLWARRHVNDAPPTEAPTVAPPPVSPGQQPRPRSKAVRPVRAPRDPLLRRLEAALGERVLAIRLQRPDGTVELDVFDREKTAAWR